jgi:hypothetical protein
LFHPKSRDTVAQQMRLLLEFIYLIGAHISHESPSIHTSIHTSINTSIYTPTLRRLLCFPGIHHVDVQLSRDALHRRRKGGPQGPVSLAFCDRLWDNEQQTDTTSNGVVISMACHQIQGGSCLSACSSAAFDELQTMSSVQNSMYVVLAACPPRGVFSLLKSTKWPDWFLGVPAEVHQHSFQGDLRSEVLHQGMDGPLTKELKTDDC